MGVDSIETQKLPDGTLRWTVGPMVLSLLRIERGVLYLVGSGPCEVFVPPMARALEDEIAQAGRIVVFANLLEATRVTGSARDGWSDWAKRTKDRFSAHCLVRSKLVDMGLSLISMFSGNPLRSYTDVAVFEAALRRAAPGAAIPAIRSVA
jgi:hypothetical protein